MHTFTVKHNGLISLIIGSIAVVSMAMMFGAYAASPPTLPGARLVRPTLGNVSGSTAFEADLAQSSPQDGSTVAFALYRLIDGNPETGRFCFLSPTATHVTGTTRWLIASVDTRTITGNCSSSQTTSGTLRAPRDGTYRFGIWIDGTEYLTPDSLTIQNGNPEDVPITNEEPPPQNQNQNINQPANQNTNTQENGNSNSNGNTNQNQNTNTAANSNVNPAINTINKQDTNSVSNSTTNTEAPSATNQPEDTLVFTFTSPQQSARVQDTVEVSGTVSGTNADKVDEVVFSVYSRSVWYTVGRAQNKGNSRWTLTWDTAAFPDGNVFGILRAYLIDDSVYATEPREFIIANGTSTSPTGNTNTTSNANSAAVNGTNTISNGIPTTPGTPPALDTDNDGLSDAEEIMRGTNPHRPDNAPRKRLFSALPPSQPLTSTDDTLDGRLSVTGVRGPGITAVTKQTDQGKLLYSFMGTGTVFDYLTLYVYSEENPLVFPVQVNAIGTWITDVEITLEPGDHTAYVALVNESGEILKKSQPFAFTVDEKQLKKDTGGSFPWVWVVVGLIVAGGVGGWFAFAKKSGAQHTSAS